MLYLSYSILTSTCYCFVLLKDGRISFEEFKAMMKMGADWKMASRQYSRALLNALSFRLFKDKSGGVTN